MAWLGWAGWVCRSIRIFDGVGKFAGDGEGVRKGKEGDGVEGLAH